MPVGGTINNVGNESTANTAGADQVNVQSTPEILQSDEMVITRENGYPRPSSIPTDSNIIQGDPNAGKGSTPYSLWSVGSETSPLSTPDSPTNNIPDSNAGTGHAGLVTRELPGGVLNPTQQLGGLNDESPESTSSPGKGGLVTRELPGGVLNPTQQLGGLNGEPPDVQPFDSLPKIPPVTPVPTPPVTPGPTPPVTPRPTPPVTPRPTPPVTPRPTPPVTPRPTPPVTPVPTPSELTSNRRVKVVTFRNPFGGQSNFSWVSYRRSKTNPWVGHYGFTRTNKDGSQKFHYGIDIYMPVGTNVHSTMGGKIKSMGEGDVAGKWIRIDHGNGITSRYLHLGKILVKEGQIVKPGQVIALSGKTGNAKNLPDSETHLHFEIKINNQLADPGKYIGIPFLN